MVNGEKEECGVIVTGQEYVELIREPEGEAAACPRAVFVAVGGGGLGDGGGGGSGYVQVATLSGTGWKFN